MVKCHSTAGGKLIAAVLDKLGVAKQICPDESSRSGSKSRRSLHPCLFFMFFIFR